MLKQGRAKLRAGYDDVFEDNQAVGEPCLVWLPVFATPQADFHSLALRILRISADFLTS